MTALILAIAAAVPAIVAGLAYLDRRERRRIEEKYWIDRAAGGRL
jgi:hypothetical protein